MVTQNDIEIDNITKTLSAMCKVLAEDIAKRDNRSTDDVLADAYLGTGRDLWCETLSEVVRNLKEC